MNLGERGAGRVLEGEETDWNVLYERKIHFQQKKKKRKNVLITQYPDFVNLMINIMQLQNK